MLESAKRQRTFSGEEASDNTGYFGGDGVIDTDHIFILGDDCISKEGVKNGPHSTAIAIGPRLVLACAHSLAIDYSKGIGGDSNGKLKAPICKNYWLISGLEHNNNCRTYEHLPKIAVTLVKYSSGNDWALFTRCDKVEFSKYVNIDMRFSKSNASKQTYRYSDLRVYHFPVGLYRSAVQSNTVCSLKVCRISEGKLQEATEHHIHYTSIGITPGSSGGAVHFKDCHSVVAWHCAYDSSALVSQTEDDTSVDDTCDNLRSSELDVSTLSLKEEGVNEDLSSSNINTNSANVKMVAPVVSSKEIETIGSSNSNKKRSNSTTTTNNRNVAKKPTADERFKLICDDLQTLDDLCNELDEKVSKVQTEVVSTCEASSGECFSSIISNYPKLITLINHYNSLR